MMTDTERLDMIEANPYTFEAYRNGSNSSDETLYWHYKRPDGFLSKDHDNTLRATLDSYAALKQKGPRDV